MSHDDDIDWGGLEDAFKGVFESMGLDPQGPVETPEQLPLWAFQVWQCVMADWDAAAEESGEEGLKPKDEVWEDWRKTF
ncbi:MAG TPA: hypothetical protein PKW90_24855, partial [Myxococcota bacterium]|nr:hypothetical protein [Myxococcota bacterium]